MNEATEQGILDAAITAVHDTTGLQLRAVPHKKIGGKIADAEITIEGHKKIRFTAEIKKWAPQANMGAMVNQIMKLPGKGMLVADYVNPVMAEKLRENGIPYIDAAGNAFINEKPVYVLVKMTKGQANAMRNAQGFSKTQTRDRALKPTGLKVLYQFLIEEKTLNLPYREIAAKADVALGTIGWVISDLKKGGYLIEIDPKNRRLKRKDRLVEKWVEAYLERLRPKLAVGTYKAENPNWWRHAVGEIANYGAKFGGEVAAHEITKYLNPEEITIYLETEVGADLFKKFRFQKDPNGDINVFRAFWKQEKEAGDVQQNLVHPLIIYADLIDTGDVRNLEAADELLGGQFAELIWEN